MLLSSLWSGEAPTLEKGLAILQLTEILTFEAGDQRYGISLPDVVEVFRAVSMAHLPKAPAIVEGIINLRGAVVPVLDIRARFGLPAKAVEPSDHLIVARAGERVVAIRADRATDLIQLAPDAVEDASGIVMGSRYVAGVAKLPGGLVILHDLGSFLSQAEADALAECLAEDDTG